MPKILSLGLAAGLLLAATAGAQAFGGVGAGGGVGWGIPIWQPAPQNPGSASGWRHVRHHPASRAYGRISGHRDHQR